MAKATQACIRKTWSKCCSE